MTSTELKHQARQQKWVAAIQNCRSSGLPVQQWCKQRGITPSTYYRWEREVLSIADAAPEFPGAPAFAELPAPKQQDRNVSECSATLRIGNSSIDFYQELSPDLLKALVEALHYLLEQWPYLIRYLEDGRLELSNNRAERSIKPFVMGRKNWLFANTPGGAQSSSVIYSLIETAKENGLDPYRYLLWVLRNAPAMSQMDEAWAEQLLPASAPQECRIPKE